MGKIIISVPDTSENKGVIASLLGLEGVTIQTQADLPSSDDDFLTLEEAAQIFGVNYHTFRRWVIEKKVIPSMRPSGAIQGKVYVVRGDLKKLAGQYNRKLPGRKSKGVNII